MVGVWYLPAGGGSGHRGPLSRELRKRGQSRAVSERTQHVQQGQSRAGSAHLHTTHKNKLKWLQDLM